MQPGEHCTLLYFNVPQKHCGTQCMQQKGAKVQKALNLALAHTATQDNCCFQGQAGTTTILTCMDLSKSQSTDSETQYSTVSLTRLVMHARIRCLACDLKRVWHGLAVNSEYTIIPN